MMFPPALKIVLHLVVIYNKADSECSCMYQIQLKPNPVKLFKVHLRFSSQILFWSIEFNWSNCNASAQFEKEMQTNTFSILLPFSMKRDEEHLFLTEPYFINGTHSNQVHIDYYVDAWTATVQSA